MASAFHLSPGKSLLAGEMEGLWVSSACLPGAPRCLRGSVWSLPALGGVRGKHLGLFVPAASLAC